MNFYDSVQFPPLNNPARRMLQDVGAAPFKFTRRFEKGASKLFRAVYDAKAHEQNLAAASELVQAGYADTKGLASGNFIVKLTAKGAALSRHLSS